MSFTKVLSVYVALWFFSAALFAGPLPQVTNVSPAFGTTAGTASESITITGTDLTGATNVQFGPTDAVSYTVVSATTITARAPASVPGAVDITVTTSSGTSSISSSDVYTYQGDLFAFVADDIVAGTITPINLNTNIAAVPFLVSALDPVAMAITPNGRVAMVADRGSNSVTFVSLTQPYTIVSSVLVGTNPVSVAITPNGEVAYVVNQGSNSVSVIQNISSATPLVIATIAVGSSPSDVAITPDGLRAFVANSADSTVDIIDTTNNTVIGAPISVGAQPVSVAVRPDGQRLYVVSSGSQTVTIIDISGVTPVAIDTISVGAGPIDIAITPNGLKAYVANSTDNSVTPIDLINNMPGTDITGIQFNVPTDIAITPNGLLAYVTNNGSDSVTPIDLTNDTLGVNITGIISPAGIVITPDQAPVAAFTANPAQAGSPTIFDAASSLTTHAGGTIATYHWNFGDLSSITTSSPTIAHTYTTAGPFSVTLTVTDADGTSTEKTFTGKTVSNDGGAFALLTKQLNLPPTPTPAPLSILPPSQFTGVVTKHHSTYTLTMHWMPSPSTQVVRYELYARDELISLVSATATSFAKKLHPGDLKMPIPHKYKKFLHKKYKIRAVAADGSKSSFVHIVIP